MKKLFERFEWRNLLVKATTADRSEVVMLNKYHKILGSTWIE